MIDFPMSPREMLLSIVRNRYLIKKSIQREVIGRYRGSLLGILWSFFNPLFMLVVYTFVFSVVFQARWGETSGSKVEFALLLFSGLIVFNLFAECVNRAPTLILSNVNYVKRVVFPLEILPIISFGGALFHFFISFIVWVLGYVFFLGAPHGTMVLLPLVLLPLAFFILGLSWLLASLGVYLRDVGQIINILVMALMFLSPIFYSISRIPENYRVFLRFNPLVPIIESTRDVIFWGQMPHLVSLSICYIGSLVIAWLGFAWFQKTRKGFADVL